MDSKENNWSLGEIVQLPWKTMPWKQSGATTFGHLQTSRYVCIRQSGDDGRRGVLLKVVGPEPARHVLVKGGEPFCKDEKVEGFLGNGYYSFRFPSVKQLQMVLSILRDNPQLQDSLKEAKMRIDLNATFWVRDTSRRLLFLHKPQYYDPATGALSVADASDTHCRLTIAYFYKTAIVV